MSSSVRERLEEFGTWMQACGEGIYGTRGASEVLGVDGGGIEWLHTRTGSALCAFALLQDGPLQHGESSRADGDAAPVTLTLAAGATSARLLGAEELKIHAGADGNSMVAPAGSPTEHAVGLAVEL